ncbi:acyltransferase family protein [uncultured Propionivibrio sp.]|uniref:acyltransferase family protein n=1 Tax=uncultured Propionivibrio sp. TaxID=426737 RepID=UPI0029BFCA53|nr:acyltransferase family protein [uncultured Propionivibrio sp.]
MANKNYDPVITGLRAYSIVAVLLFHFFHEQLPWLAGYKGVDVFFVISGYLIIGHITHAAAEGRFTLPLFYAKRIIRLFPALLIMLSAVLTVGHALLLSEEYRSLAKYALSSIFFFTNIVTWLEINYFDANAELKPLVHMWSLGVEEQFYAAFPFIALVVARFRLRMAPCLATLTVLSMLLSLALSTRMPAATFYLLPTRFWEIGIGGLIAVAARDDGSLFRKLRDHLKYNIEIGMALIFTGMLFQVPSFLFLDIALPVLGAACVMLDTGAGGFGRRLVDNPPANVLGLISYPLYIFHFPLLAAYAITGHPFSAMERGLALAALGLLAYLTYRCVETRFANARRRAALAVLGVASLAVAGTAAYVDLRAGLPDRILGNAEYNQDIDGFHDYKKKFTACTFVADSNCLTSLPAGAPAPTITVVGDSHADHSFPGIADAFGDRNVVFFGVPSCPPLRGIVSYDYGDRLRCTRMNDAVSTYVAGSPEIDLVILTFAMPFYYADKGVAYQHLGPNDPMLWNVESVDSQPNRFAAVTTSLARTVDFYLKAGKQVVLMLDAPELPFMPAHCIERGDWLQPRDCTVPRTSYLERQRSMREFVQTELAGRRGFFTYDPIGVFCDDRVCRMRKDGRFLYRDSNHLSIHGSQLVAEDLRRFVESQGKQP